MRRTVASLTAVLITLTTMALAAVADDASAMPLKNGLGGTVGYGTSCIPPNDDGSYPLSGQPGLDITPAFPAGIHFYAGTYTKGWINNNGSLSFQGAISTYTPSAFPGAPQPMIAPYWADVDTRGTTYCNTYPSGGSYPLGDTCKNPTSNGVWWDMKPGQLVITWDHVGYFLCHLQAPSTNKTMDFQMILTSNTCGAVSADGGMAGTNFDIEFRYNECGWETGDASGGLNGFNQMTSGTAAQAGFDSAEMPDIDWASLPMSRIAGISTELCTQSNVMPPTPGLWRFAVRGGQIMCPSAGQPCMTGRPGVCGQGTLQCPGTSMMTTCVPTTMPGPTKCNGLDNNCDGVLDTTCPTNEVCVGSVCVPACVEGDCGPGKTCTGQKVCVETACIGIVCDVNDAGMPTGKRCVGGVCVDDCSGVTCPIGQICRLGSCVDPCAGINCGMGQVCENGACVPTCPCRMCMMNQTCLTMGPETGHCVETDCATVNCAAGTVCKMGACVDACMGAVCPMGQTCKVGQCVDLPMPDGGKDASIIVPPDSSMGDDSSAGDDAGDDGPSANGFGDAPQKTGCGCRTTQGGDERGLMLAAAFGIAAMFVRRRRRPSKK